MDVDAVVRKPQVCVVDELAHTNVPGSREGLEPALIPERVMVCMSSNALAPRVIRSVSRAILAAAFPDCYDCGP